jgi:hypothetical protein
MSAPLKTAMKMDSEYATDRERLASWLVCSVMSSPRVDRGL